MDRFMSPEFLLIAAAGLGVALKKARGAGCLGIIIGLIALIGIAIAGFFAVGEGDFSAYEETPTRETPSLENTPTVPVNPEATVEVTPTESVNLEATTEIGEGDVNEATVPPTATSDLTFPPVAPETETPELEPEVSGGPQTPTPVLS